MTLFSKNSSKSVSSLSLSSILLLSLVACGESDKEKPVIDEPPSPPVVISKTDNEVTYESAIGVWHRPGYGELIHITESDASVYEVNTVGCLIQSSTTNADFLENTEHFEVLSDESQMTHQALGDTEVFRKYYTKIDELPGVCADGLDSSTNPIDVFEHFWHTFNDHYAFFDQRDVDWQSLYQIYRPKVNESTNDEELFALMSEMLSPLEDGHVFLDSPSQMFNKQKQNSFDKFINKQLEMAKVNNPDIEQSALIEMYVELQEQYKQIFSQYVDLETVESYEDGADDDNITWAKTSDNVGIISITSMSDYYQGQLKNAETESEGASLAMQQAIESLENTDALIIDIRRNSGGSDAVQLAMASYFTDQVRPVYTRHVSVKSGSLSKQTINVSPGTMFYNKPVYLLVGPATSSAGETFAIAMSMMPNVLLVGQHTWGAMSDMLPKQLLNGWQVTLSNESIHTLDGESHEVTGIAPDFIITEFSMQDYWVGRSTAIDWVLNDLGKNVGNPLVGNELRAQVNNAVNNSVLTGLSIAAVQGNQIVWQHNSGIASLDETPINSDSIFRVSGGAKAVLGTSLALGIGEFSIDPFDNISTPLMDASGANISWVQLATHSSGILDTNSHCGYLLKDSQTPLLSLINAEHNCPESIDNNSTEFLVQYLLDGGNLYSRDNFAEEGQFNRSDIGASLAAVSLEHIIQQSGRFTNYNDFVSQQILVPLEMENTSFIQPEAGVVTEFYDVNGDVSPEALPEYTSAFPYATELFSSSNDMANFVISNMNRGKLAGTPELVNSLALVFSHFPINDLVNEQSTHNGLFWSTDGAYVGISGNSFGGMDELWFDEIRKIGFVILATGDSSLSENQQAINNIKKSLWQYLITLSSK